MRLKLNFAGKWTLRAKVKNLAGLDLFLILNGTEVSDCENVQMFHQSFFFVGSEERLDTEMANTSHGIRLNIGMLQALLTQEN